MYLFSVFVLVQVALKRQQATEDAIALGLHFASAAIKSNSNKLSPQQLQKYHCKHNSHKNKGKL